MIPDIPTLAPYQSELFEMTHSSTLLADLQDIQARVDCNKGLSYYECGSFRGCCAADPCDYLDYSSPCAAAIAASVANSDGTTISTNKPTSTKTSSSTRSSTRSTTTSTAESSITADDSTTTGENTIITSIGEDTNIPTFGITTSFGTTTSTTPSDSATATPVGTGTAPLTGTTLIGVCTGTSLGGIALLVLVFWLIRRRRLSKRMSSVRGPSPSIGTGTDPKAEPTIPFIDSPSAEKDGVGHNADSYWALTGTAIGCEIGAASATSSMPPISPLHPSAEIPEIVSGPMVAGNQPRPIPVDEIRRRARGPTNSNWPLHPLMAHPPLLHSQSRTHSYSQLSQSSRHSQQMHHSPTHSLSISSMPSPVTHTLPRAELDSIATERGPTPVPSPGPPTPGSAVTTGTGTLRSSSMGDMNSMLVAASGAGVGGSGNNHRGDRQQHLRPRVLSVHPPQLTPGFRSPQQYQHQQQQAMMPITQMPRYQEYPPQQGEQQYHHHHHHHQEYQPQQGYDPRHEYQPGQEEPRRQQQEYHHQQDQQQQQYNQQQQQQHHNDEPVAPTELSDDREPEDQTTSHADNDADADFDSRRQSEIPRATLNATEEERKNNQYANSWAYPSGSPAPPAGQ